MNMSEKNQSGPLAQVFVIEDHVLVREGFVALINREPDLTVCAEADSPKLALQMLSTMEPDLIVMDLMLQGGDGLQLIKEVRTMFGKLPILVVTMQDESIYAERALRAGATGYIMKENATEIFLEAIRQVLGGEIYLSRKMQGRLITKVIGGKKDLEASPVTSLTDRELHVFQLIGAGMPTREIAGKLDISSKTVESHRENIKNKLGYSSGPVLVREAMKWVDSQQ